MKKEYVFLIFVFLFGFFIRLLSIWPSNTIIGFDQARDLFDAAGIIHGNLRIIGPTAGNNPNLHHGIAWLYFMAPALLFSGNPISVVIWNCLFNAFSAVTIYFIAILLFKQKRVAIPAAIITSVSYYFTQFSGWLSNPTGTFFSMPLFILGVLLYFRGRKIGLPIAAFFLGLTIEFELFFVYLIPISILLWIILKPKIPSLKLAAISLLSFMAATSTMIATELKFGFAGVRSILTAGQFVGGGKTTFFQDLAVLLTNRWETFYLNIWPQNPGLGTLIAIAATLYLVYEIVIHVKNRKEKREKGLEVVKINLFLLVLFFSPAVMFILGIHNAPWFYIGRPLFAILIASYILSKIKSNFLLFGILLLIVFANLTLTKDVYGKAQPLLEPDKAAILSTQISVMKYTYQKAGGEAFAIDSVTNPLYINAVWAWNYNWYSKNFGYKPKWLGGDQLPPYNTLEKATGQEKYMFLIIDETPRIPPVYTENSIKHLSSMASLVEEKEFGGIKVIFFERARK